MTRKINAKAARKLGVRRFDAAEYLRDEPDIAAYLRAAAAEQDPRVLAAALGDVARASDKLAHYFCEWSAFSCRR